MIPSPQPGPQRLFAACAADIAFFASSPGSGKSLALCLEVLRWRKRSNYTGVLLRSSYKDLVRGPTSLFGTVSHIGRQLGGQVRQSPHPEVRFATEGGGSSSVLLLHGNTERSSFDGLEIALSCWDEANMFDKDVFDYVTGSRARTTCGIRPYARGSVMPSPDTWVHELAKPWLDSEGYAKEDESGKVRWFFYDDRGLPCFFDDEGSAREAALVVDSALRPRSLSFIFAKTTDNIALMRADPGYLDRLSNLPPHERKRLLHACWEARPSTAGLFDRTWFKAFDKVRPKDVSASVRGWDFAATLPSEENPDPDWTRGVRMDQLALHADLGSDAGRVIVSDVVSKRDRPAPINDLLRHTVQSDGPNVIQAFARDPGSAGVRDEENIRKILSDVPGCGPVVFGPTANKVVLAKIWSDHAQAGRMGYLRAAWNGQYFSELDRFPSPRRKDHDDQVDATSYGFREFDVGQAENPADALLRSL